MTGPGGTTLPGGGGIERFGGGGREAISLRFAQLDQPGEPTFRFSGEYDSTIRHKSVDDSNGNWAPGFPAILRPPIPT